MNQSGEHIELFRGDPLEELTHEPPEAVEVMPGEPGHSPALPVETAGETVENGREEKMERLMKNVSEFIRKIDITAL